MWSIADGRRGGRPPGPPPPGGGRRGGLGGGGFGGGVPSSAALTASIGSRNGRGSSLTVGMIAVCRSSKWLTGYGALRYSLAVRAPLRAVRVREPFGGRTAPSTYDFTR